MTEDEQHYLQLLLEQNALLKEQLQIVRFLREESRITICRLYDERQRLEEELDLERSMHDE